MLERIVNFHGDRLTIQYTRNGYAVAKVCLELDSDLAWEAPVRVAPGLVVLANRSGTMLATFTPGHVILHAYATT